MRLSYNLPWMIWAVIIMGLSVIPGAAFPDPLVPEIDKYVHIVLYVILVLLMYRALRKQFQYTRSTTVMEAIAFSAAVAYGIIIEIVQETLINTRSFEAEDILADGMGACLGLAGWYLFVESGELLHRKG